MKPPRQMCISSWPLIGVCLQRSMGERDAGRDLAEQFSRMQLPAGEVKAGSSQAHLQPPGPPGGRAVQELADEQAHCSLGASS